MDWQALLKTFLLCLISISIEAASATKSGKDWFQQLQKPKYSFSLTVWYFIGAVYYFIFGFVAYRIFSKTQSIVSPPIILLALIMIVNGLSNFIIFKFRSTKWFYLIMYPFGLLLLILIIVIFPKDKFAAILLSVYFLWVLYDLYYCYFLWKFNDIQVKR
jgi:translocator protein